MRKAIGLILGLLLLTGCVVTRKLSGQETGGLSRRIDVLAEEMEDKDREISSLRFELAQVRQECSKRTILADPPPERSSDRPVAAVRNQDGQGEIIRIPGVSADQVQLALKRAGYYQGPVDGKVGEKTKQAIKAFQKANHMKVDGIIGRETWSKLKNSF